MKGLLYRPWYRRLLRARGYRTFTRGEAVAAIRASSTIPGVDFAAEFADWTEERSAPPTDRLGLRSDRRG